MILIFYCFGTVKHFEVHTVETLVTSLSPKKSKAQSLIAILANFWFEFFDTIGIFITGNDETLRK